MSVKHRGPIVQCPNCNGTGFLTGDVVIRGIIVPSINGCSVCDCTGRCRTEIEYTPDIGGDIMLPRPDRVELVKVV